MHTRLKLGVVFGVQCSRPRRLALRFSPRALLRVLPFDATFLCHADYFAGVSYMGRGARHLLEAVAGNGCQLHVAHSTGQFSGSWSKLTRTCTQPYATNDVATPFRRPLEPERLYTCDVSAAWHEVHRLVHAFARDYVVQ